MNIIHSFFEKRLERLDCDDMTRAYITGIFSKYKTAIDDLSTQSITLTYAEAKNEQSFQKLNNIADWLFFAETVFPQCLNNASKDYYYTIGRLSYYSCYKLTNKKWIVFEFLADRFIDLTNETRELIKLNQ
jgi:hypothetical protein